MHPSFLALYLNNIAANVRPIILHFVVIVMAQLLPADSAGKHGVEIHTDGPITTGAQATVTASLTLIDGSTTRAAGSRLHHFHWIHAPLVLTEESDNSSSSQIKLLAQTPGNYTISVWVTRTGCHSCPPIAKNRTKLLVTNFLLGELTITQEKKTFSQHGFVLSTGVQILVTFLLYDPSKYLKSASFTYAWDFGDGFQLITEDPSIGYNYSAPGSYVLNLEVVAEIEFSKGPRHGRHFVQKTGHFAAELELLDAVTGIQVKGSTKTHAREQYRVLLHINGSPPLTLCWLLKLECVPVDVDNCHVVALNTTDYLLTHTFNDEGEYCLSVRTQNEVSMLQVYYSITVTPAAIYPMFFVLPCAVVILTAVCFIAFALFRSSHRRHRYLVED
ncbi:transmembrane protein 130 isoform X2 [Ambystoma mexicanum]|uniref:transmembrane protein 130 isoform X2 n=1 Tax=Ambystoma mexicanum TaxID=8296 RepID=UPI0037E959B6